MMSFTQADLEIFQIPTFQERMGAIRSQIRPKLEAFGSSIAPLLKQKFKRDFFAHTAKHMRRKVNPPDETWVALGPMQRGYKAYIFFSLCIGKQGVQARVVMKDESHDRALFGQNLMANLDYFKKQESVFKKIQQYLKRDSSYQPEKISLLSSYLKESAHRLQTLKGAMFDMGFELNPYSKKLELDFLKATEMLYPIFLCGLEKGVKLR
ncbi:MAG: DUF1054 family protein [Deltaproteobacteria bacterium]|nr:DUF1054 family protein [Deltaproteobacteria bacterium]